MFPDYWAYVIVMALVTYAVRALPMTLFSREIENRFVLSFLYYVPYACLAAMVFPAILTATASFYSGLAGLVTALVMAYMGRSLITVSVTSCLAVFIIERLI